MARMAYRGARYAYKRIPKRKRRVSKATKSYVKRQIKRARGYSNRQDSQIATGTLADSTLEQWRIGQDIQQGTNVNQRISMSACIKGFHLRWDITNENVSEHVYFRIMMVKIKDTDPIEDEFFKGNNSNEGQNFGTVTAGPQKYLLPLNKKRFKIMWQKRIKLAERNATNNYGRFQRVGSKLFKLRDKTFRFDQTGTNTGVDDIYPRIAFLWYWEQLAGAQVPNSNVVVNMTATTYFCHQ